MYVHGLLDHKVKAGDLVQHCFTEKIGIILKEGWDPLAGAIGQNKVFDVMWNDGNIGKNVWNYDLYELNSS